MSADDNTQITDRMRRLLDAAYVEDDEAPPIRSKARIEIGDRICTVLEAIELVQAGRAYQRPRNALDELFRKAPVHLWALMSKVEEEVEAANPKGKWPNVPYHYGMGRLMAYEHWLGQLDEQARAQAIAACGERYEAYYQRSAELLVEKMRGHGFDLTTINRDEHENDRDLESAALSVLGQLRAQRPSRDDFGWGGPTLGGGRSRSR